MHQPATAARRSLCITHSYASFGLVEKLELVSCVGMGKLVDFIFAESFHNFKLFKISEVLASQEETTGAGLDFRYLCVWIVRDWPQEALHCLYLLQCN